MFTLPLMVLATAQISHDVPTQRAFTFAASDGTQINGVIWESATPSPHPGILLLHMCGPGRNDRHNYDSVIGGFADRGFTVMAYNHRGHGDSDFTLPQDRDGFMDVLTGVFPGDAITAYDILVQRPEVNPDSVFVVGSSCGTFAATAVARERKVAGVALLAGLPPTLSSLIEEKPELPILAMTAEDDRSGQVAAHRRLESEGKAMIAVYETGGHGTRILDARPESRRALFDWVERSLGNRRAIPGDYDEFHPQWSPDGRYIAFDSDRSGSDFDVYVHDLTTSRTLMVTGWEGNETHPSWSPDGTSLVFEHGSTGNTQVHIMNLANRSARQVTNAPGMNGIASFSPDGGKISFASNRSGQFDIFVADLATGNEQRLTTSQATDMPIAWTPDGASILFHSNRNGQNEIFVLETDGGTVAPISGATGRSSILPTPIPDSDDAISFWSDRDGQLDLYSTRSDGTRLRRLTRDAPGGGVPSWSPDGELLTFFSDRSGRTRIWIMDPRGELRKQVTPD